MRSQSSLARWQSLGQKQWEVRDSRRKQDSGDNWWFYRVGEILPFEVQAQRFLKIRESLIHGLALTDYVNVKAPRDIPRRFVGNCDSELHKPNRTSGLCRWAWFLFCALSEPSELA